MPAYLDSASRSRPVAARFSLHSTASAATGSRLRKYTIGSYGRITLQMARAEAQKVFAARLEGRDPAAEKREAKRRMTTDRVEDLIEVFTACVKDPEGRRDLPPVTS